LKLSKKQEINNDDIIRIKNLTDNFNQQKEKATGYYQGEYISRVIHNLEGVKEYIEYNLDGG
jgi:hypothetical protein